MKRAVAAVLCLAFALSACASAPPSGHRGPNGRGGRPPGGSSGAGGPPREQVFISPAGEPFRSPPGEPYPLAIWWNRLDPAGVGSIGLDDLTKDFERFFAVLDADKNGEITSIEVNDYETRIAPEILRGGAGMAGAAGYSLLNDAEPVRSADANLDGRVTLDEYRAKAKLVFERLDKNHDGRLARAELPTPAIADPKAQHAAAKPAGRPSGSGGRGGGRGGRGGGGRGG